MNRFEDRENLYINKKLVRTSYRVSSEEGKEIVESVKTKFPDINWYSLPINWIGTYGTYREPYFNSGINWYEFKFPSKELLKKYAVKEFKFPEAKLNRWYGLKFDLTTNETMLKLVFHETTNYLPKPDLPLGEKFYARIYKEDGTTDKNIDCYITCDANTFKKYCDKHKITYPMPDDNTDEVLLWGVIYNAETLDIIGAKGYTT
jgi:hypothetical protein